MPATRSTKASSGRPGTFTDPGTLDTHTVDIDWGDGSTHTVLSLTLGARTFGASHLYVDDDADDTYVIMVTVVDDDTGGSAANKAIVVNNIAPNPTLVGPNDVNEASTHLYSFTTTDPGVADTFVLMDASCGTLGDLAWVDPFDPADGSGSFNCYFEDDAPSGTPADPTTVRVELQDDDGDTGIYEIPTLVRNLDPSADIGADQAVNEGTLVSFSASVTDPSPADTFPGTLWQVSASNGQVIPDGAGMSFSFTPNDNGTYMVTFTVNDDDGGVGTDTAIVTVSNVPPTVTAPANQSADEGSSVAFNTGLVQRSGRRQPMGSRRELGRRLGAHNVQQVCDRQPRHPVAHLRRQHDAARDWLHGHGQGHRQGRRVRHRDIQGHRQQRQAESQYTGLRVQSVHRTSDRNHQVQRSRMARHPYRGLRLG